jgi:Family of unknown function (DUF6049)
MARPAMLRSLVRVLLAAIVAVPLATAQSARAQTPSVSLRLRAQTPWNSPQQSTVELRFAATNMDASGVGDLTLGVVLYSRVGTTTRSGYERSLLAVPSPASVIDAETLPREGTIAPGETRVFQISLSLTFPGIDTTQSGIYPLAIELRSGDVAVATLRTPVIYLVRRPLSPMQLAWTFVLDQPIGFRSDGVFTSTALEHSLGPGGRIAGEIRALLELAEEPAQPAVDVAVSPRLLIQLARMRAGYTIVRGGVKHRVASGTDGSALAGTALEDLRRVAAAPNVELSALPFAAPELPSLLSGRLSRDLPEQLDRGALLVQNLLGTKPDPTVLRPPAGALDEQTVAELASRGVRTLLLDAGTVAQPTDPLGFALPPTGAVGPESSPVGAVLPDQAVSALLQEPPMSTDPVLAAHAALGELVAIWQERPGTSRGIALAFTDPLDLPGGFFPALARGIASAPWLKPVTASQLLAAFPPSGTQPLTEPSQARFASTYVADLRQARRRVETLRPMLVDDAETPARMETSLLLAESGGFLSDPNAGLAFIDAVNDEATRILGAIRVDTTQPVTLTSRTGARIPLRVTNVADRPLRVTVDLVSVHLTAAPSQTLVIGGGQTQTLTFTVDLKTNGRFPVDVQIDSPTGRPIGRASTLTVRSTAFNQVALVITLAAAGVLLLLWARRFLPRRTS